MRNESVALEEFEEKINHVNEHPGFTISRACALISTEFPFLAASLDAIFTCPCYGNGVIEVKCPFKFKNVTITTAAQTKGFPFIYSEEKNSYSMDKDHAYYFQVQPQLFIAGYRFAYFVVYTTLDMVYVTVPYDADLLSVSIPQAKKNVLEVIMPEVLGGYFYLKSAMRNNVPQNSLENKYLLPKRIT